MCTYNIHAKLPTAHVLQRFVLVIYHYANTPSVESNIYVTLTRVFFLLYIRFNIFKKCESDVV